MPTNGCIEVGWKNILDTFVIFSCELICFLDLSLPCMNRDFEFIRLGVLGHIHCYCYFMVGDILP